MTAEVPARRFGTATEVAAVAAFLASPAAAYVNGVSIPVDGGEQVLFKNIYFSFYMQFQKDQGFAQRLDAARWFKKLSR